MDTSAISLFDFSKNFINYKVEDDSTALDRQASDWADAKPAITVRYTQSRVQNQFTWSVNSLDLVLGLVGGLAGVVYPALFFIFGGYENFKFENSLISAIYPTSPQDFVSDADASPESERKAKAAMMKTVSERGKYFYNYSEYLLSWILSSCCCCACGKTDWYHRRVKRYERHETAREKLAEEIDII